MEQYISTTTTLRAPLKETLLFVNYYLNLGVDHMFLFFDNPEDLAVQYLENNPKVSCIRCDSKHWKGINAKGLPIEERQHYNSMIALQMTRDLGMGWIIHVDHDELIYSSKSLKSTLEKVDQSVQVVNFPTLEAVSNRMSYENVFQEIRLFKVAPPQIYGNKLSRAMLQLRYKYYEKALQIANFLGCHHIIEKGYVRGHTLGKSATRTTATVKRIGNHYPTPEGSELFKTIIAPNAWLLHYDACGFDNWLLKWERRYNNEARAVAMSPIRKQQGEKFIEFYRSNKFNKLKELYRELYFLSKKEIFILKSLGLLRKVVLMPSNFGTPDRSL